MKTPINMVSGVHKITMKTHRFEEINTDNNGRQAALCEKMCCRKY